MQSMPESSHNIDLLILLASSPIHTKELSILVFILGTVGGRTILTEFSRERSLVCVCY
jgi:hypothetical protein